MENGKELVHTHGEAYTFGSANSTLASPVLVANASGLRIIPVNQYGHPIFEMESDN
jgi:hypothetical protein